jgi:DnaK suppressor protein
MKQTLTAEQRQALRTALQARQQAIEQQLLAHRQGHSAAELALARREQGGNDAVQLASEREVAAALTGLEERELLALTAALQRVDAADYGLCTSCGKAIPYGRLLIEPQAPRCVACETRHEKENAA